MRVCCVGCEGEECEWDACKTGRRPVFITGAANFLVVSWHENWGLGDKSRSLPVVWWGALELSQARDMGPSMKTLTLIIMHPCHRLELMRVEWNVKKSAEWLQIGIHACLVVVLHFVPPGSSSYCGWWL